MEPVSTCENPQFPSWMWRYNRNKHLSRFEPWTTRAERWPPRYRNMGMPVGFDFRGIYDSRLDCVPDTTATQGGIKLGVNFATHLHGVRKAGFGNSALGNPPGPAPPRLFAVEPPDLQPHPDLYPVNMIYPITDGVSLIDHSRLDSSARDSIPLDPAHYLSSTLNQTVDFPGTFPAYNTQVPTQKSGLPVRTCECPGTRNEDTRRPMELWEPKYRMDLAGHAQEYVRASRKSYLPDFDPEINPEQVIGRGNYQCVKRSIY